MLKKIISGNQPGVEIAALDAAIQLEIPHAGWAYKGRKTEDGVLPEQYNVQGIDNPNHFERLEKNIIDCEGTVILTYGQLLIGLKGVQDLAEKHRKPCLHLELRDCTTNHAISSIRKWMENHEIDEGDGSRCSDSLNIELSCEPCVLKTRLQAASANG